MGSHSILLAVAVAAVSLGTPARAADGTPSPAGSYGTLPGAPVEANGQSPSAAPNPPLNGAASVQETYGDWTVACRVVDGKTACAISQAQGYRKSGEQVFGIELQPAQAGGAGGTILMPFGLQLDAGAIMKLDDQDLGDGLRFSTCVPQGCLLPVRLALAAMDAIGKATALTVSSLDVKTGAPVTFKVSMNGFRAALDRAAVLSR